MSIQKPDVWDEIEELEKRYKGKLEFDYSSKEPFTKDLFFIYDVKTKRQIWETNQEYIEDQPNVVVEIMVFCSDYLSKTYPRNK